LTKQDNSQLVAILSYITLLGWIIALILNNQKKTKLGSFHLRQALIPVIVLFVGTTGLIGQIIAIIAIVLIILGIVAAINKEERELPIIGKLAKDWFKAI